MLDSLRGPLEEGLVRISRSGGTVTFPCRFSLLGAMNPCPCGFREDSLRQCTCAARTLTLHDSKVSGPLLDRFDMQVVMTRLSKAELLEEPTGDTSVTVRHRVEAARALQEERYGIPGMTNASAPKSIIESTMDISAAGRRHLERAIDSLGLSGRGYNRLLRVLRTIADLNRSEQLEEEHVAQAVDFRLQDKLIGALA